MKPSSILVALIGVIGASAAMVNECESCDASGAVVSCRNCINPSYPNNPDSRYNSNIELSKCFANAGGQLVFRKDGGFAGSCGSIQVNSDGVLSAKCKDGRGGNVATSISIGRYVHPTDYLLDCWA